MAKPPRPQDNDRLNVMHLFIVNPNSTVGMTDRIGMEARQHLPRDIRLTTATNPTGPASIQGEQDGHVAEPGTVSLMLDNDFDAAIIGCFDDTGLATIAGSKDCPVIGLGKAAFLRAHETGRKFAVLTTSELSVPVLEANIKAYGLDRHCVLIRASAIDVLDFETGRDAATDKLIEAAHRLKADHPEVEAIVLGCAGMGGLSDRMQQEIGVLVIDPIKASVDYAVSALQEKQHRASLLS